MMMPVILPRDVIVVDIVCPYQIDVHYKFTHSVNLNGELETFSFAIIIKSYFTVVFYSIFKVVCSFSG